MNYELYVSETGQIRANIGDWSYPVLNADQTPPTTIHGVLPGEEVTPRTLAQIQRGDYGEDVQAWEALHAAMNLTPRFAPQGVINSLGDHNSVGLPWQSQLPRDYQRGEQ